MAPAQTRKRSGPPAFPHLHPTQAKKAKQAWIDKVKLKSKWQAEKRKNGWQSSRYQPENESKPTEDDSNTPSTQHILTKNIPEPPHKTQARNTKSDGVGSSSHKQSGKGARIQQEQQPERDAELKELTRRAYSRESLHTYKSDPLHRGRREKGQGVRGRGQPDMKLRMNALLEKIKRDVATD